MKVALASDHAGFYLKQELLKRFGKIYSIIDLGATEYNPEDDYPDFAFAVAREVASGKAGRGIIICGSGVGAGIAANKIKGARAGVCHDTYSARQGVEHDDMNILCLGSRVIGIELAVEIVTAYLKATFHDKENKYVLRLMKIKSIESK